MHAHSKHEQSFWTYLSPIASFGFDRRSFSERRSLRWSTAKWIETTRWERAVERTDSIPKDIAYGDTCEERVELGRAETRWSADRRIASCLSWREQSFSNRSIRWNSSASVDIGSISLASIPDRIGRFRRSRDRRCSREILVPQPWEERDLARRARVPWARRQIAANHGTYSSNEFYLIGVRQSEKCGYCFDPINGIE